MATPIPTYVELQVTSHFSFLRGASSPEELFAAAAVLGHPALGPAWLANKLHPYGETLEAGEIILGGSFTAPVPARAGDTFHVDFGPLGAISVRFA